MVQLPGKVIWLSQHDKCVYSSNFNPTLEVYSVGTFMKCMCKIIDCNVVCNERLRTVQQCIYRRLLKK